MEGSDIVAVKVTELYEENGKQKSEDNNEYTIVRNPELAKILEKTLDKTGVIMYNNIRKRE